MEATNMSLTSVSNAILMPYPTDLIRKISIMPIDEYNFCSISVKEPKIFRIFSSYIFHLNLVITSLKFILDPRQQGT
jgi:hypothetical protein